MNVYEVITARIIAELERGTIPWQQPWKGGGLPKNLVTKKEYRGINPFVLGSMGYLSPYWVSYKQTEELGGHVKKGEKGTPVVFWKMVGSRTIIDEITGEELTDGKNHFVLRYYTVFNSDQCEGLNVPAIEKRDFNRIAACEAVIAGMPQRPDVRHGGNRACYKPYADRVEMPLPEYFDGDEKYYSVLFHELVHSTGHEKRLARKVGDKEWTAFGTSSYSKEELVAEMGAAFLSGHCGIEKATLQTSTAYIASWLRALRNDPKMIVLAGAGAQKAADYILRKKI